MTETEKTELLDMLIAFFEENGCIVEGHGYSSVYVNTIPRGVGYLLEVEDGRIRLGHDRFDLHDPNSFSKMARRVKYHDHS